MAAEPLLKPLALCEQCWLENHTNWEPQSMDEHGSITMKLVGVDTPDHISLGNVDVCCMCGQITIAGIYEMLDPTEVYFVGEESDSFNKFEFDFSILDEQE